MHPCPSCAAPLDEEGICTSCGALARGFFRGLDLGTPQIAAAVAKGLDFYQLLGVAPAADVRTIARRYRQLRVLFPDDPSSLAAAPARRLALLEHAGLYERLTAEENLEFYGRIARLTTAERRARIKALLAHVGLWERRQELVGTWSRGMKQKLAVARALLHQPQLLFLDEPTAGLDAVSAAALRDDLRTLVSREGLTVFLTTHNLSEAEKLCTQVAVIRNGALLAVGQPDALRARTGGPRVEFVGRNFSEALAASLRQRADVAAVTAQAGRLSVELVGETEVAPLVELLVRGGAQVEEVQRGKATLEEAFLDLLEEPA